MPFVLTIAVFIVCYALVGYLVLRLSGRLRRRYFGLPRSSTRYGRRLEFNRFMSLYGFDDVDHYLRHCFAFDLFIAAVWPALPLLTPLLYGGEMMRFATVVNFCNERNICSCIVPW